jgi:hypothetical protein
MTRLYRKILPALSAAVACLLTLCSPAWGAPTVMIVGRGNSQFEVMGEGFQGVGGIEMTLGYDRTVYAEPRVSQGGLVFGAMMVPNLTVPGMVKVGIISPNPQGISGNGSIVTLTFNPVSGAQGNISNVMVRIINLKGAEIQAQILNSTGSETGPGAVAPSSTTGIGSTSGAVTGGTVQGAGPVVGLGGVTMPDTSGGVQPPPPLPPAVAPVVAENDRRAPPEVIETPVTVEESLPAPAPAPAGKTFAESAGVTKQAAGKSIPELFREYPGPRTYVAMAALFPSGAPSGARQEPPIALSDGSSRVKVYLNVTVGARSPNFALNGAKLVSLRREDGLYVLEVIPDSRVNEARVTILNNGSITDVPLVVTQPLDLALIPGGVLNETALDLFLKGGPGKRSDLNGDGKIDSLDDYIITANYLVKKKTAAPKAPAAQKTTAAPGAAVKSAK